MRIFVTGATGYIGKAVVVALARAGHEVYGLVRSEQKARELRRAEVIPVLGTMQEPGTFLKAVRRCEASIHCAVEYTAEMTQLDNSTLDALLSAGSRLIIYTSGVWIYGDTGNGIVDESSPLKPAHFLHPRAELESRLIAANSVNQRTIIVRPGCVYGGAGGLTGAWFDSAEKSGAAQFVGDGAARWAMIHVEDLADLYVRAAESPWGGEVFNATDRSRFTVRECAEAASRAAGADGKVQPLALPQALQSVGPMAECLVYSQHIDSTKAVRMLGWQPRHGGFVDNAALYYQAWKAN